MLGYVTHFGSEDLLLWSFKMGLNKTFLFTLLIVHFETVYVYGATFHRRPCCDECQQSLDIGIAVLGYEIDCFLAFIC